MEKVMKLKKWLIEIRRDFHQYPELGMNEFRTMGQICKYLDEMGIKYKKNIANTGIIADIKGEDETFTVALRADMDALPIQDNKEVDYASKIQGRCHACGHDAHMSILLGVAKYFSSEKIKPPYNIRLLFQPAEETVGGAKPMIEAGALENVDLVFGLHMDENIETGMIGIRYGSMNASSDTLRIKIYGESCHGAYPSKGVDAIVIAAHTIIGLQSIVSRNLDARESGVITIGKINAGTAGNIVSDYVELVGTLRTLNPDVRKRMLKRIDEMVTTLPIAYGGKGEFIREEGYTALVNHERPVTIVKENAIELFGPDKVYEKDMANMGVEDFAYFIEEVPGAFFTLGCKNKLNNNCFPAHNGNFDIDEDSLVYGVMMQIMNIYNGKKYL
ncbi:MAG: amidohydrolase [Cetobacterium sp.]|uniref:M20 metallopeptidase family protein n=1 Tax=Cetobacterium sp. TaxID=2071632 RepID=UPI002FC6C175